MATVAAATHAYAVKVADHELAARSAIPASAMTSGRGHDAAATARAIHADAAARVALLAPFGVTPAMLAALDAKITAFADNLSAPRDATVATKTVTSLPPALQFLRMNLPSPSVMNFHSARHIGWR